MQKQKKISMMSRYVINMTKTTITLDKENNGYMRAALTFICLAFK